MPVTIAILGGGSIGLFLVILNGPSWAALPALVLLVAPYLVLFGALLWFGAREVISLISARFGKKR